MAALLGISAYYHDSAAALIVDGTVVAAVQEERFSRIKFDARFPIESIRYCLTHWSGTLSSLDAIVFYDKPIQKFDRLLETHLALAPRGVRGFVSAMPGVLKEKLPLKRTLRRALAEAAGCNPSALPPLLFCAHHQSHAASAYYPSPFDHAAVLCVDGVGEWSTTSLWQGNGARLSPCWELRFPHSLGLLYAAFTQFCGFRVNADEYKLMGLAPYGSPVYVDVIRSHLIDVKQDGTFRLNLAYFDFAVGLSMFNECFCALFGGMPRAPDAAIGKREMDLACSIQRVTEEILLRLAATAHRELAMDNLCLAGGVALNCAATGRLRREGNFKRVWVQPAAGDAGGAIGAALGAWYMHFGHSRQAPTSDAMDGARLGPAFDDFAIETSLVKQGAQYRRLEEAELMERVAERLAAGKAVGWFDGRMEFGPRALGARSILADPRDAAMRERLNARIKRRESFRPFAPIVTEELASEYFSIAGSSPYMSFAEPVMRSAEGCPQLAAVTHVDGSARVQTVSRKHQPRLHRLLEQFSALSGVPVLVNTSFNGPDEPIVNSPEQAYRCFIALGLDCLVTGNYLVERDAQRAGHEAPPAALDGGSVPGWLAGRLSRCYAALLFGAVYFMLIAPAGWISRMLGRDPLRLGFAPDAASYRVVSAPPNSMELPF